LSKTPKDWAGNGESQKNRTHKHKKKSKKKRGVLKEDLAGEATKRSLGGARGGVGKSKGVTFNDHNSRGGKTQMKTMAKSQTLESNGGGRSSGPKPGIVRCRNRTKKKVEA